jgi:hypothetical protein
MRWRNRPRRERISPMRCMSPYSTVRCVNDHPIDGAQVRSHVGRPAGDAAPTSGGFPGHGCLGRLRAPLAAVQVCSYPSQSGLVRGSVAAVADSQGSTRARRCSHLHWHVAVQVRIPTRRSLTAQLRASAELGKYRSNRYCQFTGSIKVQYRHTVLGTRRVRSLFGEATLARFSF